MRLPLLSALRQKLGNSQARICLRSARWKLKNLGLIEGVGYLDLNRFVRHRRRCWHCGCWVVRMADGANRCLRLNELFRIGCNICNDAGKNGSHSDLDGDRRPVVTDLHVARIAPWLLYLHEKRASNVSASVTVLGFHNHMSPRLSAVKTTPRSNSWNRETSTQSAGRDYYLPAMLIPIEHVPQRRCPTQTAAWLK
jgi:hypothetical protein